MSEFHFSASQTETFKLCPRKWAFQKIDKIQTPPHPAAELGSAAHLLREKWLLEGEMPSDATYAGKLALAGIHFLPMPKTCEVEKLINIQTEAGRCTGRIDFFIEDQKKTGFSNFGWNEETEGIPLVGDHKTTGNERWIKTIESLTGDDAQAIIYAHYAFQETNAKAVDLFWSYMIKKPTTPLHYSVRARVERNPIEEKFAKIVNQAKVMLTIFDTKGISAKEVPYDVKGCDAFGGCPFLGICEKEKTMTKQKMKSPDLMESLTTSALPSSSENSIIQRLSKKPPEITVAISPPDAPSSSSLSPPSSTPPIPTSEGVESVTMLVVEELRKMNMALLSIKEELCTLETTVSALSKRNY